MNWLRDFILGLATILDFSGSLSRIDPKSDDDAFREDWAAVNHDLQQTFREYGVTGHERTKEEAGH